MKKSNILFILLGITTIIGQTVLLRELLIEVNGNEIVFSIYLSLWLLLVAVGSYIAGYFLNKTKLDKIPLCAFFLISFITPLQFLSIRFLSDRVTIISGQMINIPMLFFLAFLVLLPGCVLNGFLFPILCKLVEKEKQPVHKGYIVECIGIIIGGLLFAVLIHFLGHFPIIIILSALNIGILMVYSRKRWLLFPLIFFIAFIPFSGKFYLNYYAEKYTPQNLISSKDSKYGRLDVTISDRQKNYYYNGEIFANSQSEMYAQQMVNFVMLQHPNPQNILLIGGLLNGYIDEIGKYEIVKNIDYFELEKNILEEAGEYPEVNFIKADAIHYLKKNEVHYDLILIDLPDPSSLNLNRFYTLDFFRLLYDRTVSDSSVVAITLSSGTNFMTSEIIQLNSTIYTTFSEVFGNVILIPSIKNIFIGSDGTFITNDVDKLSERMQENQPWFNKTVIFEKCNKLRKKNIMNAIKSKKPQVNMIASPNAYLSTILLWTRILGLRFGKAVDWAKEHQIITFMFALILILLFGIPASRLSGIKMIGTNFNIFSVSLVNFVMQLVLLNLFQMNFGYVFLVIFLFTTTFMAGLTAGFAAFRKYKQPVYLLFILNLFLIVFVFAFFEKGFVSWFYFILNFGFAFLEGAVLSRLLNIKYKIENIRSGSTFYFIDSLGAMAGGIIVGVLLFPVIGLRSSVLFLAILIFVNIVLSLRRT